MGNSCCGPARRPTPKPQRVAHKSRRTPTKSRPPRTKTKCLSPTSQGEQECKRVLESIFPHHKFEKVRPKFLFNPETKRYLELDLYNPSLKLAVEYNGRQHYEYTPCYHSSRNDLAGQKWRDALKVRLCREEGIRLITVRYDVANIESYLISELNTVKAYQSQLKHYRK